jgi:vitamin K-dependent gamma-carboxylase
VFIFPWNDSVHFRKDFKVIISFLHSSVLGPELTDFLIVHQFGCIFDLSVAFFLIYKPTRPLATVFSCSFHLMNSRLFNIGMFPWTCIVLLPLYYSYSWPRVVWQRCCFWKPKVESSVQTKDKVRKKVETFTSVPDGEGDSMVRRKRLRQNSLKVKKEHVTKRRKVVVALILTYCALQLFLPYSHFITKGYNNWTNGLYGYSWDMMINAWDTVLVSIKIVDNNSATSHFLDPYVFAEQDRWTKHADMAHQYANCIAENLRDDFRQNKQTILQSEDISIYFDVWCSMNGRFQQRMFNPNVDLLTARWHPFETTSWVLPLLEQYSQKRPELIKITKDVLSWNNFTDVLYIADFPGLSLENYIGPDLDNITLTVLEGKVVYRSASDNTSYPLAKGEFISVKAPGFHDVHTISKTPACYMYTFVNKTMQEKNEPDAPPKPMFPIVEELHTRWQGYKRFFAHVANSFLYEIYGVPMPRRLRAVH